MALPSSVAHRCEANSASALRSSRKSNCATVPKATAPTCTGVPKWSTQSTLKSPLSRVICRTAHRSSGRPHQPSCTKIALMAQRSAPPATASSSSITPNAQRATRNAPPATATSACPAAAARALATSLPHCGPAYPAAPTACCSAASSRPAARGVRARDSAAQYREGLQLHVHHRLPTLEHRELLRVGLPLSVGWRAARDTMPRVMQAGICHAGWDTMQTPT